jgi:hypothetical protein
MAALAFWWFYTVNAGAQKTSMPSTGSTQELVALNFSNNGQQVTARMGEQIEITLGTIGPKQYGTPEISSPAIRLEGVALNWPVTPGGPTFIYIFEAASEGEAQVTVPVIGGITPEPTNDAVKDLTFRITIRVEPAASQPLAPYASRTVDQANTAPWTNGWTNVHGMLRQTFMPSLPRLTGVEVELVVGNPGPASAEVTMSVMNAEGATLASVSKTVPAADCRHVLFRLPKGGLRVSPGQVYSIALSSVDTVFGWKYVIGGYAKGVASFNGFPGKPLSSDTRSSFLFRTFGRS